MIIDLLAEHGITPRRVSGGEYHSPCPRCGGTDRFHVWPEQNDGKGSFWCRHCDVGGDCIKFLMEYSGLDFKAAAARVGKQLEQYRPRHTPSMPKRQPQARTMQPRQCQSPAQAWQQQAQKLVLRAAEVLQGDEEQLQYLASRGISANQAAKWQLGYIVDDKDSSRACIYSSRKKWGLPPKPENRKPDALWIPRGIVIPTVIADRVDSIRIRRSKADRQRALSDLGYHVLPGSGTAPLLSYSGQRVIVVTEAQLDAILIDQVAGDLVGVLPLGNNSARPDGRAHRALQSASLILVALDNDQAGQQSTRKWLEWYDTAAACPVPTGKDPGDAYQSGIDLRQWLIDNIPTVWTTPKNKQSAATKQAGYRPEHDGVVIRSRSGRLFGVVDNPANRQAFAAQTGLNVLVKADIDMLAKMEAAQREQWLVDNDPRRSAVLTNCPDEYRDIVLYAANLFGSESMEDKPHQEIAK